MNNTTTHDYISNLLHVLTRAGHHQVKQLQHFKTSDAN
jgi:hypothetical protein